MTKEMEFFIYLLEHYASYKKMNANNVLTILDRENITDLIYEMYEKYHTEAIENAYNDIDKLMNLKEENA